MSKIIFAVLLLITVQTLCETNTDVMTSFNKDYEKLHQKTYDIQNEERSSVQEISQKFSLAKSQADYIVHYNQEQAKKLNSQNVNNILKELNITASEAEACIAKDNNYMNSLVLHSNGALHICKSLDADVVKDANEQLSEIYKKQAEQHHVLEGTRLECKSTSADPAELRNCLSYALFVEQVRLIKQLKDESDLVVKQYGDILVPAGDHLKNCANVAKKIIEKEQIDITFRFKTCCNNLY